MQTRPVRVHKMIHRRHFNESLQLFFGNAKFFCYESNVTANLFGC